MGGFCEHLEVNGMDPDDFIKFMNAFLSEARKFEELHSVLIDYRNHLDKDELLDKMERFLTKVECEQLQRKIRDLNA